MDLVEAVARGFALHFRNRAREMDDESLDACASEAARLIVGSRFLRQLATDLDDQEMVGQLLVRGELVIEHPPEPLLRALGFPAEE